MIFIYSLVLLAIAALFYFGNARFRVRSLAALAAVALMSYFTILPAAAATNLAALGANDSSLTTEQQEFEEDLKLTPDGGQYSGIEHTELTNSAQMPVDDASIEDTIEAYSGENVVITVANGSVRLSGRVKDKEAAEGLVEKTKDIPGVREVTFDLGLENKAK